MDKLQFVQDKIKEAVPEIMDLVFGCKLLRHCHGDNYASIYYVLTYAGQGRPDGILWISSIPFGSMTLDLSKDEIKNGGEFEILGREIQLADVFSAILRELPDSEEKGSKLEFNIITLIRGSFGFRGWNLAQPLSGQSEETIDFLYQLLR